VENALADLLFSSSLFLALLSAWHISQSQPLHSTLIPLPSANSTRCLFFAILSHRFGVAFFALSFPLLFFFFSLVLAVEARGSTQNMERQAELHSDTQVLSFFQRPSIMTCIFMTIDFP